jgi:hypothetical protein
VISETADGITVSVRDKSGALKRLKGKFKTAKKAYQAARRALYEAKGLAQPFWLAVRANEAARIARNRPDDDNSDLALFAAYHLVKLKGDPIEGMKRWAFRAGWNIPDNLIDRWIAKASREDRSFGSDAAAKFCGVTDAERTRLRLTTIGSVDVTREMRAARRKAKKKASANKAHAAKRRREGKPTKNDRAAVAAGYAAARAEFGMSDETLGAARESRCRPDGATWASSRRRLNVRKSRQVSIRTTTGALS